jgi:hypothetical protein
VTFNCEAVPPIKEITGTSLPPPNVKVSEDFLQMRPDAAIIIYRLDRLVHLLMLNSKRFEEYLRGDYEHSQSEL